MARALIVLGVTGVVGIKIMFGGQASLTVGRGTPLYEVTWDDERLGLTPAPRFPLQGYMPSLWLYDEAVPVHGGEGGDAGGVREVRREGGA